MPSLLKSVYFKGEILKNTVNIFLALCLLFAFGCSTKTSYTPIANVQEVPLGSTFKIGEITDKSGFVSPANPDESIDLKLAMGESLRKALKEKGSFGEETSQWTIEVEIVEYEPGNAFVRWLLPGAGATKLKVVASIINENAQQAAKIAVERSIGFGGGYTIGAWKYVFDEVAREIVGTLTDPSKRAA